MDWLGWLIVAVPLVIVLYVAFHTRKYIRDVVDYLAAGRLAGRYVICVGDLESGLGVISLVAMVEEKYQSGLALGFWGNVMIPIGLVISLTGYCIYRFRQTRALSMGQFLEMRYSRAFRIVAAMIRTIAEMLANAIGPAIAGRFFIYMLGFPHQLHLGPITISTFTVLMIIILFLSLCIIWPSGRLSLIITDCLQGLMSYPIFVIFTIYVLTKFSFVQDMAPIMHDRVPGESFLNPNDLANLRDFNLFGLFVVMFSNVLNRAAWIGNDTSGSARTPHEQKMAGILGTWRNGFSAVMCMLISIAVYSAMNSSHFAADAHKVRTSLINNVADEIITDNPELKAKVTGAVAEVPPQHHEIGVDPPLSLKNNPDKEYLNAVRAQLPNDKKGNVIYGEMKTLYYQMMLPTWIRQTFPMALMGLFCLLMSMLLITTDSARIFNASSTLIQDVVMPLRGRPFTKEQHFKALRICTLGVCIFFFLFSISIGQVDFLNMILTIFTSLWLGAAGPIMVFGLYSRFGTTRGAWAALIVGSGISGSAALLQMTWAGFAYPLLDYLHWVGPLDHFLQAVTKYTDPYVVWSMNPVKFPINSREVSFIAMISGIVAYVVFSLLSRQPKFNLDQMLHRGAYAIASDQVVEEERFRWTLKNIYNKIVGITPEYTRGDKILTWSVLIYSLVYQFLICFVGVIVWNMFSPITTHGWTMYFNINNVILPCVIGIVSTVWFLIGGVIDMRQLFRDLKNRTGNLADDGWVEGHVSLADQKVEPVTVTLAEEDKKAEDLKK